MRQTNPAARAVSELKPNWVDIVGYQTLQQGPTFGRRLKSKRVQIKIPLPSRDPFWNGAYLNEWGSGL